MADDFLKQLSESIKNNASPAVETESVPTPTGGGLTLDDLNNIESEYQKYDAPIRAGLEGAARGATFGLSDVALTAIGDDESDKALAKRREFNPVADIVGQTAGVVGSSLLMPTFGLTGAVTKVGKLAEGAIAKGLVDVAAQSTAKKILSNVAAKGLGSAVEGAFYGAGQVVSEAALGDPKEAAENALSTIGLSSLLSGSIVGALNVVAPAIKGAAKYAKPYIQQARQQLVGVSPEIENVILTQSDKVKQILDSADNVEEAIANRWSDKAVAASEARYQTIDRVKQNVDDLITKGALAGKKQSIRPLFDEIQKVKDKISPLAKGLTGEVESEFAKIADAEHRLVSYVLDNAGIDIPAREFNLTFKDLKKAKIPATSWKLNPLQLNEIKTTYFKSADFSKQIGKVSDVEALYQRLGSLANEQLDKVSPGIRQENAILRDSLSAQERLKSYGLYDRGQFDAQKLRKISSIKDNAKWAEIKSDLSALDKAWGTDLLDTALLTRAAKEVAPKDLASAYQTGRSLLAPGIGGVLGTAFGGPVGTALGVGAGLALTSPAGISARIQASRAVEKFLSGNAVVALNRLGGKAGALVGEEMVPFVSAQVAALSQLERANKKVDRQIDAAVSGVTEPTDEYTSPTNLTVLGSTNFGKGNVVTEADRQHAYSKRIEELRKIIVNPENMANLVEQNLRGLSMIAPKISQELSMNATNAAMFLYNKAPKPIDGNGLGIKQTWQPSDSQLSSWERYVDAVENPSNVLKDLQQRRLTKEGVEALNVVYPAIYQKLKTKISEKVFDKSLSYQDRLQLSSLFKLPVERALQPKTFGALQNNYKTQEPQNTGSSFNVDLSKSRQTQSQRIEGR